MEHTQKGQYREQEEDVIELLPLLKALWKGAWIVVAAALLFGSGAYIGTRVFVTPTYQAQFTAYVNNRDQSEGTNVLTSSDLTAAQSLVHTYASILTSRSMLESAAEQAGLDYSYSALKNMVTTEIVTDTEIITVKVVMDDPVVAQSLAEAIAEGGPDQVAQIVEGTSMQVIDTPVLPTGIYEPNYIKNTAVGMLLGGFLAAAVIVLRELLDDTVKDEEGLENRFGIAIVGTIPDLAAASKQGYGYYSYGERKEAVK